MVQLRLLWTMSFVTSGFLTVTSLQLHDLLSVKQLNSPEQRVFSLPMEITNRVFNSQLLNSASEEYKSMYKEVTDLLDSIYDCSNISLCPTKEFYGGVAAVTFSSGSVIANSTLVFDTSSINPTIVHKLFENANNFEPKTLQLNLNYTTTDKIKESTMLETTTTTTPMTTTMTPTKTTTTPTTPMTTTTTPTKTNTTPTTPMTTTTTHTTTTTATTAPTSTTATMQDPTTPSSSDTNVSPDDTTLISTTITHHGNHDATQDPVVENATTVNPHDKWTDSQGVSVENTSDPQPSGGGSSSDGNRDWIPRWGIALLVLGAAISLLVIIVFVMMLVQCCKKNESIQMDTTDNLYYTEKKQLSQEPLPVYSPQTPMTQTPGSAPVIIEEDTPKKNKTGFYAVNP